MFSDLAKQIEGAGVEVKTAKARMQGGGKEHGTNKPAPTGRIRERSKGDPHVSFHLPEAFLPASMLAELCVHRQEGL